MFCHGNRIAFPTGLLLALSLMISSTAFAQDASDTAIPALQPKPEKVLVRVNGEELTEEMALRHILKRMPPNVNLPPQQRPILLERFKDSVVQEFVGHVLLKQEAEEGGIEITKAEVDEVIDQLKQSLPEGKSMEEGLKERGITIEELRADIEKNLAIPKLLKREVPGDFEPAEEEVAAYYEGNLKKFTKPETVHARHILARFEPADDEAAKKAKREKMESVREKLLDGADFAELAKEHSDCPSSKKGGDLGTFQRGRMVKPFEEAAFSQDLLEIGDILQTKFGYHIIQVLEHEDAETKPLADVKDKIREELERQKRSEATREYIETLKADANIVYPQKAAVQ